MKLRNKKTGFVSEIRLYYDEDEEGMREIDSNVTLKQLSEDWEDYIPRKDYYWYIGTDGSLNGRGFALRAENGTDLARYKIGNCFETRQEAEDALEKLIAWKKLKDRGFKFDDCYLSDEGFFQVYTNIHKDRADEEIVDLLMRVFNK